jgi:hypothetical protein
MTNVTLARLLGLSEAETRDALNVLEATGVASRDHNGAIMNRRMVREEERRDKLRQAGSKGGSQTQAKREATPYHPRDNDNDIGVEGARSRVREFARGEGIGERDADWFFWKCEGNGWTNGGKPILDWKATIRSWWKGCFFPSQKRGNTVTGHNDVKPLDKSKIDVPERFKAWVAEHYPEKREVAMKWQKWSDVPYDSLRQEWWKEEKAKLPIDL